MIAPACTHLEFNVGEALALILAHNGHFWTGSPNRIELVKDPNRSSAATMTRQYALQTRCRLTST